MADPAKSAFDQFAPYAPWIAIGVNFLWNYVNFRRTSKIRALGIHVEEFRRLRTSVDAILSEFRTKLAVLEGMTLLGTKASQKKALEALNSDLSDVNTRMTIILEQLCESTYAQGEDWLSCYEYDFEIFIRNFQTLYAPDSAASPITDRYEICLKSGRSLVSSVNIKLENNMIQLANPLTLSKFWAKRP